MANLSYCRFTNGVRWFCPDVFNGNIYDDLASDAELRAHARLVALCRQIAAMFDDEADDAFDELEAQLDDANSTINNMAADCRRLQQRVTELEDLVSRQAELLDEKGYTQQEAMLRFQKKRIAELEAQLAATLVTIDEAASGIEYAEGCKP